eukprot:911533-Rhodomonas_salina.8
MDEALKECTEDVEALKGRIKQALPFPSSLAPHTPAPFPLIPLRIPRPPSTSERCKGEAEALAAV